MASDTHSKTAATQTEAPKTSWGRLFLLSLTSLGVVYGDIGTSPLYAVRECFFGQYGVDPSESNVLGVLSLIIWSLILVISVKYLVFILRADNDGEGGDTRPDGVGSSANTWMGAQGGVADRSVRSGLAVW